MKQQRSAKLFTNGKNQAVRIPEEWRFEGETVQLVKTPHGILITQREKTGWDDFFDLEITPPVSEDFMSERDDDIPQKREFF